MREFISYQTPQLPGYGGMAPRTSGKSSLQKSSLFSFLSEKVPGTYLLTLLGLGGLDLADMSPYVKFSEPP